MPDWWTTVLSVVTDEFSDLSDVAELTRVCLRLGIALAFGAVVGYDRERRDRPAGLRTHMLVALGSAAFTLVPLQMGFGPDAMSRVIQGVVVGIGFLGAGTILKLNREEHVQGLTTAASVFATSAIGVAVGLGRLLTGLLLTVMTLLILRSLVHLERKMDDTD